MTLDFIADYSTLLVQKGPEILAGFVVTLKLLVGSCLAAFILMMPLAVARVSANSWLRYPATVYSSIFRGTPLLVQIFIFYYGLSQFVFLRNSVFWPLLNDSFYCGLTVLTLNLTAYMAENVRAGIQAVPYGEREAAVAYGLSRFQCYRYIILPRALRIVTPVLGNDVIGQMKATALVSTITVMDMTGVVRRLSARSYTMDALLVAGVIYALTTLVISLLIRVIERQGQRHQSR